MTLLIILLALFGLFMTWLIIASIRLNKHRGNLSVDESIHEMNKRLRGSGGMHAGGG